jgi:putative peptide zinc metalloprotease protein
MNIQQEKKVTPLPPLRRDLKIFPAEVDASGAKSNVVFDPVSDRYFRMSGADLTVAERLDGTATAKEICAILSETGMPYDEESVLGTVAFLAANGLLKTKFPAKTAERRGRSGFLLKFLYSYLFFKIPLWDPDRFLSRTTAAVAPFAGKWPIIAFIAVSLCGYACVTAGWERYSRAFLDSLRPSGFIMYLFSLSLIKVFHELAHAYSAKFAEVRVRKFGIGFIFFLPRLYTDISDAWRIRDRKTRLLIDGAGILTEMVLGGLAALVWALTDRGAVNTIAYYVSAVAVAETILVNGNPFLRFDGYYLLMDLTGMDNLQIRASAKIRDFIHRVFFGVGDDTVACHTGRFLLFYGFLSFAYRFLLYTSIITAVYFRFAKIAGLALAAAEIYLLFIQPLATEIKMILHNREKIRPKRLRLTAGAVVFLLLLVFIPLPWNISMPCEINPGASAVIYAENAGFLDKMPVSDGDRVEAGTSLFSLSNPFVEWDMRIKDAERKIALAELDQIRADSGKIPLARLKIEQLKHVRTEIDELKRMSNLLSINSPIGGVFLLRERKLQPGRWVDTGTLLGEVFSSDSETVHAYAEEKHAGRIKPGDSASIVLNGELRRRGGVVISVSQVPRKIHRPSPLLSICGGRLETVGEKGEIKFLKPHYEVMISPDAGIAFPCGRTGEVRVRKYSSLGGAAARAILSVFIRESSL